MPSRAYTSLLHGMPVERLGKGAYCVNALTGLYLIATRMTFSELCITGTIVSMPSRAYTSLLRQYCMHLMTTSLQCQCPHGLIPHCYIVNSSKTIDDLYEVSMPSRAYTSLLPGYLPMVPDEQYSVNALTGLYLIATKTDKGSSR